MHIKLSFCRCSLLSNSFNHTFQVFVGRLVACLPTKTYQPHGWLALACLPSTNQLMKLGSWNWKILAVLEASASLTLKQLGNFFQNVFIFRFFFLKNIIFLYETGPIQWIFSQHYGYWWPCTFTLALVATVRNAHPCISGCLWVNPTCVAEPYILVIILTTWLLVP